ncbi:hybrid sensor histidine kinase/response regulator [Paracoccus sp. IB05]|uniref:ATP-binding response regulator n=1 Tax=Paracoccus sp. IB05 TaxID=2779367 RepID=UPI0018E70D18|nr:hybrid sensor histidine kinase/response regulator [Paracoccus sp. IB05]MBJ2152789.1 hybrid sensor histidine kinase/response regulator [Paracoccus sp. IB05]
MEQNRKHNEGEGGWRPATVFCLTLMPAAGQILTPLATQPTVQPLATAVYAAVLTGILTTLLPMDRFGRRITLVLVLLAALLLQPAFGVSSLFLPAGTGLGEPGVMTSLCWGGGALLALLARASRQVLSWQAVATSKVLIHPIHLIFACSVYATGFWLIATLVLPGLSSPFSVERALLAAALAAFTPGVTLLFGLAVTIASDRKEMAPSDLTPALLAIAAMLGYGMIAGNRITAQSPSGFLTLLLVPALLTVFLMRRFWVLTLMGMLLCLAAPLLCGWLLSDPTGDPGLLALLLALPFSIMRTSRRSGGTLVRRAGDPPPAVISAFSRNSTSWLVLLDLEKQTVHFPFGSAFSAERGPPVSFSRIFQESASSGLLDLLRELQKPEGEQTAPVRIRLQMKPAGETRREVSGPQLFEARVLKKTHPTAWLALFSLSHEKELAERAERAERLLADAVLREERLLSFAAHELRTPIAILSMLAEELRNGALWEDVREGFEQTMDRISSIIEDLMADSGASALPVGQSFTPIDLISQLLEIFSPVATTHGITIEASRTDSADLPLRGDFARVFIALSKLLHNAILHSQGSAIRLSVIASRGAGAEVMLTWQVADNGIGIPAAERARMYEPFSAPPEQRPGRGGAGLGLYTARKAITLLGGELNLLETPRGAHFVLSHPVRSITTPPPVPEPLREEDPADPAVAPRWFARQVLLIEDNRLVGEITRTRLRRLFRLVDRAETGPAGLDMWERGNYDLILVDQLLPGSTGCEIVREIRKTDKNVPIIGITASTLGSECRDLEAAGVTLALEKPLSYSQLLGLAEEWFPAEDAYRGTRMSG